MSEWISVLDRLPPIGFVFCVWDGEGFDCEVKYQGSFFGPDTSYGYMDWDNPVPLEGISHWMEWPDPPITF